MADIQNTIVYKVLGFKEPPEAFQCKLASMEEEDRKNLVGICGRLAFINQIEMGRKVPGWNIHEHILSYQFERLKLYLTITCIDAITGTIY